MSRDDLPMGPTIEQVREAVASTKSERSADVESLALLLLSADSDGDAALLDEIHKLLLEAAPHTWLALDSAARRTWWYTPDWSRAAAQELVDGDPSLLGLVMASFHSYGYAREAAVARLAVFDDDLALVALALRCVDWVPEIRQRARSALKLWLDNPSGPTLQRIAPVAFALNRRHHGAWLADRLVTLMREGSDEILSAGLSSEDFHTRRIAYGAALSHNRLTLPRLLAAAGHDRDIPIRLRCAEAALNVAIESGNIEPIRPLFSNRSSRVRSAAVVALAHAGDVDSAIRALSDRSPTVRSAAQAALRQAGLDPAERYRELTTALHAKPADLAGLGETGRPDDAEVLMRSLEHPLPAARAEAVRALRRLGSATPAVVGRMLTDPSPRVTRQVTTAILRAAPQLEVGLLLTLVAPGNPEHCRRAAYLLLRERDTWSRLLIDLELLGDESARLRSSAHADLQDWLARGAVTTYSVPKGEVAELLRARLKEAEAFLDPSDVRRLRFNLRLKDDRS